MARFLLLLFLLLLMLLGLLRPFCSSSSTPLRSLPAAAAPAATPNFDSTGRWVTSFRSFAERFRLKVTEGRTARKLLYRTQFGVCHRDTVAQSCQPFYNVTCEQGGFRVKCWSCEMIQRCTPEAIGCYSHFMDNITYCGF